MREDSLFGDEFLHSVEDIPMSTTDSQSGKSGGRDETMDQVLSFGDEEESMANARGSTATASHDENSGHETASVVQRLQLAPVHNKTRCTKEC